MKATSCLPRILPHSFSIFYDFAILRALYNISCGLFVTVQRSSSPDVIVNGEEERLLQFRPWWVLLPEMWSAASKVPIPPPPGMSQLTNTQLAMAILLEGRTSGLMATGSSLIVWRGNIPFTLRVDTIAIESIRLVSSPAGPHFDIHRSVYIYMTCSLIRIWRAIWKGSGNPWKMGEGTTICSPQIHSKRQEG